MDREGVKFYSAVSAMIGGYVLIGALTTALVVAFIGWAKEIHDLLERIAVCLESQ